MSLTVHLVILEVGINSISQNNVKMRIMVVYHFDVASGSEITPCNKIDEPLEVIRFSGNVMTSIIKL